MINLWPLETQNFGFFITDSDSEGKYSINTVKLHGTEKTFCWLKVKSCQKKKKTQQEIVTDQSGLPQLWLPGNRIIF